MKLNSIFKCSQLWTVWSYAEYYTWEEIKSFFFIKSCV